MNEESAKATFLSRLQQALQRVIIERLHDDADDRTRDRLRREIEGFIRENASEYSLAELMETFVSAEAAIGLFYEYRDARRIVGESETAPGETAATGGVAAGGGRQHLRMGGDVWEDQATGMPFVWVPGGAFAMGSGPWDEQGAADEKPVHDVWLDGFWIGRYPVTVAQYMAFAGENRAHLPEWIHMDASGKPAGRSVERYTGQIDIEAARNEPVTGVSWHDAQAYARWLSRLTGHFYRLPTEAQWEYAARSGGREEKFAGGPDPESVAWFAGNSGNRLHPVGEKSANGLGIYDMCGNVCEWCLDVYARDAYAHHADHNPAVLSGEGGHVVRGGSWRYGARDIRCADRGLYVAGYRDGDLGFRLVRAA